MQNVEIFQTEKDRAKERGAALRIAIEIENEITAIFFHSESSHFDNIKINTHLSRNPKILSFVAQDTRNVFTREAQALSFAKPFHSNTQLLPFDFIVFFVPHLKPVVSSQSLGVTQLIVSVSSTCLHLVA